MHPSLSDDEQPSILQNAGSRETLGLLKKTKKRKPKPAENPETQQGTQNGRLASRVNQRNLVVPNNRYGVNNAQY